jgi:hypothetical protein
MELGANTAIGDGSVIFVTETINTGDLTIPAHNMARDKTASYPNRVGGGPSFYGIWGALGSINGSESVTKP